MTTFTEATNEFIGTKRRRPSTNTTGRFIVDSAEFSPRW
jgi:hypothetical protein